MFGWIFYFDAEDFFFVVEVVLFFVVPAELFEEEDFVRFDVEGAGAFLLAVLLEAEDFVRLVLEEREVEVRCTTGSATLRRRPVSTRMPEEMLFQRRNCARETPKRSAMVTRVSPRRTV